MDLGLRGKGIVVTGGSRGIGRAIALACAAEGANLAICARSEAPLEQTAEELRRTGVVVYATPCDVSNAAALDGFLDRAHQSLGQINVLVNNVTGGGFSDDVAAWKATFDADIMASVRAVRKVVPWMKEAGGGAIVHISSIAGLEAGGPASYAAMKAGLISYGKSLAVALAPHKIRVNVVTPGAIEFPGGVWEEIKQANRGMYDAVLSTIPSGRMGTAEEVANAVAFLVSDRASWITGACVSVDGGQHKGNL